MDGTFISSGLRFEGLILDGSKQLEIAIRVFILNQPNRSSAGCTQKIAGNADQDAAGSDIIRLRAGFRQKEARFRAPIASRDHTFDVVSVVRVFLAVRY